MSNLQIAIAATMAILVIGAGIVLYQGYAVANDRSGTGSGSVELAAAAATSGDPYPLSTCPVSGEELGGMGDPVVYDHEGREIRFCCNGCVGKFKADPAKYIEKIDAEIVKQHLANYPLDTCVVTDEELGSMGDAMPVVVNNRLFALCCMGCKKKLSADPAKYFNKLDAAVIKAQTADYPLDTCVVTGEKLGSMGDPVDYVFENRLVRFCCKGCIGKFEADPLKYMAKLN